MKPVIELPPVAGAVQDTVTVLPLADAVGATGALGVVGIVTDGKIASLE